jgi:hypothetical protein
MTRCETCTARFIVRTIVAGRTVSTQTGCSGTMKEDDQDLPIQECIRREYEALGVTPELRSGKCLEDKRQGL